MQFSLAFFAPRHAPLRIGQWGVRESLPWALKDPVVILFFISLMPRARHMGITFLLPRLSPKEKPGDALAVPLLTP